MALTGVRLDAADCLYAGIATHFMPPDRIKRCVKELAEQHEGVAEAGLDIEKILNGFATRCATPSLLNEVKLCECPGR